jgi:hypothetical protein
MSEIFVINNSGEKEPLSYRKIYQSIKRSGVSPKTAERLAQTVFKNCYSGIKTKEIYRQIRTLLLKQQPPAALRFSLKEGIRRLGPTGFPFEKYMAAVFKANGFSAVTNQLINGRCVIHEIDVLLEKDKEIYIGECKFHNVAGIRVDLKVALASFARFLDIKEGGYFNKNHYQSYKLSSLLITNTKFSSQAIQYANCVGLKLLGWRWPKPFGLEYYIESKFLYPLTVLSSISPSLAAVLSKKDIILVTDLAKADARQLSKELKFDQKPIERAISEAQTLVTNYND